MELEGDVDVSEFGPEILRQQVQSYFLKVVVPGLDNAIKIQCYHRYVFNSSITIQKAIQDGGSYLLCAPLCDFLDPLPPAFFWHRLPSFPNKHILTKLEIQILLTTS